MPLHTKLGEDAFVEWVSGLYASIGRDDLVAWVGRTTARRRGAVALQMIVFQLQQLVRKPDEAATVAA